MKNHSTRFKDTKEVVHEKHDAATETLESGWCPVSKVRVRGLEGGRAVGSW